jgi:hypothetical protein
VDSTSTAVAGKLIDLLTPVQKAEFLKYFQPGAPKEWDRLPPGMTAIGLRYRFEFTTESGEVRQHDGYVAMRLGDRGWEAVSVNVDGMGEISAQVVEAGGFVIR